MCIYIHLYKCIYTHIPKMCVCVFIEETDIIFISKRIFKTIKLTLAEKKCQWKFR